MKLGEYIEKNKIKRISVATDINNIDSNIKYEDMDMIPVRYWDAEIRTVRHKINSESNSIKSIDLIAIVKINK